ncbi:MAG: type II toxin-antitoxin system RelE/ParE family toxin [Bacteroidia bacterium]
MEKKIKPLFWSDSAKKDLQSIYDYYFQFSDDIALKIISGIIIKAEGLSEYPLIGRVEELLQNRKTQYRFLVEGNYKVIYAIEDNHIAIHRVFDSRQNPVSLSYLE